MKTAIKYAIYTNFPLEMQRSPSQSEIDILSPYSSCDVSDALGQLGYASLLQNIQLLSPNPSLVVGQATRVCG